jgi:hypothetical protein
VGVRDGHVYTCIGAVGRCRTSGIGNGVQDRRHNWSLAGQVVAHMLSGAHVHTAVKLVGALVVHECGLQLAAVLEHHAVQLQLQGRVDGWRGGFGLLGWLAGKDLRGYAQACEFWVGYCNEDIVCGTRLALPCFPELCELGDMVAHRGVIKWSVV